jgi:Leucine-rich repeat (LRR) protein
MKNDNKIRIIAYFIAIIALSIIIFLVSFNNHYNSIENKSPSLKTSKTHTVLIQNSASYFDTPEKRRMWWNQLTEKSKDVYITVFKNRYTFSYYVYSEKDTSRINFRKWHASKSTSKDKPFPTDENLLEIFNLTKLELFNITPSPVLWNGPNKYSSDFTDLSCVYNLTKLETLVVRRNEKLKNINDLVNLKSLKSLTLSGCKIEDISVLKDFKDLRFLDLSLNRLCDLSPLKELTNLEYINLSGNLIENSQLVHLENKGVVHLILSANFLDSITTFENSNSLATLDVSSNHKLNQLHFKSRNLKTIICNFTRIGSLKNINISGNSLETLISTYNELINLDGLENFPSLKNLDCSNNNIESIKLNSNLRQMEFINLSANDLKEANFLLRFPNLKYIDLSSNKLKTIGVIPQLSKICHLDVSFNFISNINELLALKSLQFLNIAVNDIHNFDVLKNISSLDSLVYFSNTRVKSGEEIISKPKDLRLFIDNYEDYKYDILHLSGGF